MCPDPVERPPAAPAAAGYGTLPRCLEHCTGCGACVAGCPLRALSLASEHPDGRGRKTVTVDAARCTGCGACRPACPRQALVMLIAGRQAS